MKRNININIARIVFYIEEDAYQKLQDYLNAISQYFSGYEDSQEITSDIENRIAEIFSDKINPTNQVITLVDVEALISQMGTIQDFQEQEDVFKEDTPSENPSIEKDKRYSGNEQFEKEESYIFQETKAEATAKKLYRDKKRAILGGVASGLGHYIHFEPLWVRLLFIIAFLGFYFIPAFTFVSLSVYMLLWFLIPESDELEEQQNIKKFFRNPDDKVVAGISSGLAAYFGSNVILIRLFFAITIFLGGSGILIYFILWFITPEAKTITEKMQMEGEPITLSNIEEAIKRGLNVEDEPEESTFVKILLAPFRAFAWILKSLNPIAEPLANFSLEAGRIILALGLIIFSIASIFAFIVFLLVGFGIINADFATVNLGNLSIDILYTIPYFQELITSVFSMLLIPFIWIGILGVMLLKKNMAIPKIWGWSSLGIWIAAFACTLYFASLISLEFAEEDEIEVSQVYQTPEKPIFIMLNEEGRRNFINVSLKIRGYDGKDIKLVQKISAHGKDKEDASRNTQMIGYNMTQKDSLLIFDKAFSFKPSAKYRGQSMEMVLYIPFQKKFKMEQDIEKILRQTIYANGYKKDDISGNTWYFTVDKLICETCKKKKKDREDDDDQEEEDEDDSND